MIKKLYGLMFQTTIGILLVLNFGFFAGVVVATQYDHTKVQMIVSIVWAVVSSFLLIGALKNWLFPTVKGTPVDDKI